MFATRASAILAQVVLGWVLTKEDFRLFGLAVLIIGVGQAIHNGGIRPVLVQRPAAFAQLAVAGFRYALTIAFLTAAVLVVVAPVLAHQLQRPGLTSLLWIGAISFPLQIPALIYQAKLATELRFQHSAAALMGGGTVRSATMIASGVAGLGAMSFVVHYAVTPIFEWMFLRRVAGKLPTGVALDRERFAEFARSGRWLVLGTLGSTLALHGEKLLIDRWSPSLLGVYFFGSQLVMGITNLLQAGFGSVLLPVFSRMGDDRARQRTAYDAALRALSLVATPSCILLALIAPSLIHLTWQGRWDDAIPVVRWLSIGLIGWLLGQLSLQVISALGAWRLHATLVALDAATLIAAAALGARAGNLADLACWIAAQRLLWGACQVAAAAYALGFRWRRCAASILRPAAVGIAASAAASLAVPLLAPGPNSLAELFALTGAFAAAWLTLAALVTRRDLRGLFDLLGRRAPRWLA